MLDSGSGLGPIVTYLRTVPAVAYEAGEEHLPQIVGVCLSLLRHADRRTVDTFLDSLPRPAQRLNQPGALHGYSIRRRNCRIVTAVSHPCSSACQCSTRSA